MIDNRQIAAAMTVRLDQVFRDLPTVPTFVDGIRRAPKRHFSLSRYDTELALKNDVEELKPGERVASNGPHAGVVCVPRNLCARIPDGVPFDHAAFVRFVRRKK